MQDPSKPIWFKKVNEENKTVVNLGRPTTRLYVATPVHSECSIHYTQSLLKFQQLCIMNNIMVSFSLLKSSLVTQGRNLCVANFLGDPNDPTHLLFIDSDIEFKFDTIMQILKFDKEVISVPYPMKCISWDQIWNRVQNKTINSKDELMRAGHTFPVKMDNIMDPVTKKVTINNGLVELSHAPTGCMLIKRQVFDKMIKAYPEDFIDQPTIINGEAKTNKFMYNFFDTVHDKASKKYYGEDFGFCKKWTEIGGKCYGYIQSDITHVGEYQYTGKLLDNLEKVS
jgi:hypothetical protein